MFNMIIEVNETIFKRLLYKEKIYIEWSNCRVFEDYGIIRCFNCRKYGHISKNCKDNIIFPACSGNHAVKDCNKEVKKCIN